MSQIKIGIEEIARGAELSLKNAQELEREAVILSSNQMHSRALLLHQISMEECGKIDMLGAWAASELSGMAVDRATIERSLARHKSKNSANAYFIEPTKEEIEAREKSDWGGAREIFKNAKHAFHEKANYRKNAALYVDIENDRFVAPSERITEAMVKEAAEMNAQFIQRSEHDVAALKKWAAQPTNAQELFKYFISRMEELRQQMTTEPMRAMDVLMDEMWTKMNVSGSTNPAPSGSKLETEPEGAPNS